MNDAELRDGLARLGLSEATWRAVLLLPLVQVAWADGRVQVPERARILATAFEQGLLDGDAGALVRGWLEKRPSDAELALGREVLVALVHRHRGPGSELGPAALEAILEDCRSVARAAGGLFDLAFTVDPREEAILDALRQALTDASAAWMDALPSPPGGVFRDL